MNFMTRIRHADIHSEPPRQAQPIQRRIRPFAIALLVLGLLAGGYYLLWGRHIAPVAPVQRAPALTVTTAMPQRATWPVALAASGSIEPWQEASVGTQVGGYSLTQVLVNIGDQVRRGQVLARLDPALLRAEEARLKANVDQAAANRQRALSLQRDGAISDQDVLQFVTADKEAAAQLAANRLQLRYTAVIAPDDGMISARTATLGAVVPAGQELFRLIRGGRLEWRGELTATQLASVTKGQRIALALPDGSNAEAIVRETAPTLNAGSRLGLVYADIVRGSRARAGMYANGQLVVAQTQALVVPSESVVIHDGRSYVVTLADRTATPKVALKLVTPGRRQGDGIEIVTGLVGTETLVRSGAGFLKDGDIVRVEGRRATR
jgi:RND family efflux transporter MFP subunit